MALSEGLVSDSSPSLPAQQSSSDSIPYRNVYSAASAENLCGRGDCGGGAGDAFLLHTEFCVTDAFLFAGFISSSGNCCPMNRKGKSSPSGFLVHPGVQASICVSERSVQRFLFVSVILHFQDQAELTEFFSFLNYRNFVFESQRNLQCFFRLRYNCFCKTWLIGKDY